MVDRSVRIRISADEGPFVRSMASASAAARTFAGSLDTSTNRMQGLVQTGLALAPALVPIGAVAVPAIAGLALGLGSAAVGAGVAVLAFQGIGDTLKAMNDFALEPTTANFEKVQQMMEQVGPAGAEMAVFLNDLRPTLSDLQDTAREGLFPGVMEGIDELTEQLPVLDQIIAGFSSGLGDVFSDAGDRLNDPAWDEFFQFMAVEGPPAMEAMFRSMGNISEGLAGMVQSFDPLSDDFLSGMVSATEDFARWGRELGDSEGFQEFIDYIRDNGPQVGETLGAIGSAAGALVQALAPVGSVSLVAIEALADVFATIARSPAGPVLLGAAAGMAAVSRAMALFKVANASALANLLGPGLSSLTARASDLPRASAAFLDFGSALDKTGSSAGRFSTATQRLGSALGGAARITSGIAGLGLALASFDDNLAGKNTLTLGLLGGAFGPVGAGLGVVAGATMDAAAANDDLVASLERVRTVMSDAPADFTAQSSALTDAGAELEAFQDKVGTLSSGPGGIGGIFGRAKDQFEGLVGDSDTEEAQAEIAELQAGYEGAAQGLSNLAAVAGRQVDTSSVESLQAAANDLGPALTEAGLSLDDFLRTQQGFGKSGFIGDVFAGVETGGAIASLSAYNREQTTVAGRSRSVAAAIGNLDDAMLSTADSASELAAALDELIGPELNASEASDAWVESLRTLRSELNGANKSLRGNSNAALQNRAAIRDRVSALTTMLNAEAEAGAGSRRLANLLNEGRAALVRQATAAGVAKGEIRGYLNELNLTPKLVRTIMEVVGAEKARAGIQRTAAELRALNGDRATVTTIASTNRAEAALRSVGSTLGGIDGDTANVSAAASVSRAVSALRSVGTTLGGIDGDSAQVSVSASTAQAAGALRSIGAMLGAIDGTTATTYVQTVRTSPGIQKADGGVVDYYAGGGLRESHYAQIAPAGSWRVWAEPETGGEAYIPLSPAKRARSRSIADETVARLGGMVAWLADGGVSRGASYSPTLTAPQSLTPAGEMRLHGRLVITNWRTGEATFRGVARDEIASDHVYAGTAARQGSAS